MTAHAKQRAASHGPGRSKRQHKIVCARCGRHGYGEQMIRSHHTGAFFCRDFRACDQRAKRADTQAA